MAQLPSPTLANVLWLDYGEQTGSGLAEPRSQGGSLGGRRTVLSQMKTQSLRTSGHFISLICDSEVY